MTDQTTRTYWRCPACEGQPMSPDCAICGGSGNVATDQTPRTDACPVCGELHATDMVAHIIARHPDEAPRILAIEAQARAEGLDVAVLARASCNHGHKDPPCAACRQTAKVVADQYRAILAGGTDRG